MDDLDVLDGYINHSRYVSRHVYYKYGLDPSLYENSSENVSKRLKELKARIGELIHRRSFVEPNTGNELRQLLGCDFAWVKSSMDAIIVARM